MTMRINSYDIDGVIYMGEDLLGLHPQPNDVIITGRTRPQQVKTQGMLNDRGILSFLFINPIDIDNSPREVSGRHKAAVLTMLDENGRVVMNHFEDDHLQADIIREFCPWVNVVIIDNGGLVKL